jgi:hypothetical protein
MRWGGGGVGIYLLSRSMHCHRLSFVSRCVSLQAHPCNIIIVPDNKHAHHKDEQRDSLQNNSFGRATTMTTHLECVSGQQLAVGSMKEWGKGVLAEVAEVCHSLAPCMSLSKNESTKIHSILHYLKVAMFLHLCT